MKQPLLSSILLLAVVVGGSGLFAKYRNVMVVCWR